MVLCLRPFARQCYTPSYGSGSAAIITDFPLNFSTLVLIDCSLLPPPPPPPPPLLLGMIACVGMAGWGIDTRDSWEYWERGAQENVENHAIRRLLDGE